MLHETTSSKQGESIDKKREGEEREYLDKFLALADTFIWLEKNKKTPGLLVMAGIKRLEEQLKEIQDMKDIFLDKDRVTRITDKIKEKIPDGDKYEYLEGDISVKVKITPLYLVGRMLNRDKGLAAIVSQRSKTADYLSISVALAKAHCVFATIFTGGKFLKQLGAASLKDAFKVISEVATKQYEAQYKIKERNKKKQVDIPVFTVVYDNQNLNKGG